LTQNKTWRFVLLLSAVLFVIPLTSLAFEVKRGEGVVIGKDEVINDDVLVAGNNITVDGVINGDLKAAGANITINGGVNGDVMVAGGQVNLRGKVSDDVMAVGGTVVCDSEIGDNVMVAGGNIIISDKAKIGRDLMVGGGNILLSSEVGRNVNLGGGTVTVSSKIGGNLKANTGEPPVLTSKSEVKGDFFYTAPREAKIESGAKILGKTTFTPLEESAKKAKKPFFPNVGFKIFSTLGLILAGVVIVLLFPKQSRKIADMINSKPGKSFGIGLVISLLMPALILLLIITLLGIPLALLTLSFYLCATYLAKVFVGLWIGRLILGSGKNQQKGEKEASLLGAVALGTLLLGLILTIPFIGFLIKIVVVFLGVGAMGIVIYEALKPEKVEKVVKSTK
jgi:hypothetical protein